MLTYIELIFTAIFWGGNFVAGKIVAQEVDPFSAAFLRFVTASFCLLAINYRFYGGRMALPDKRLWVPLILLGLTGVFSYNVFLFMGLERIEASRASLIIANNPVFVVLFNALIFHERIRGLATAGILLSLAGAGTVITCGDLAQLLRGGIGLGELFIFGCVLSWVAYSLIGRSVLMQLSPLSSVTWSCILGMAALAIPACIGGLLREIVSFSAPTWMGIVYLGVFGTVMGFVFYYRGVQRIGPARASQFINFVPVSAILLASMILGEPITPSLLLGGALVLLGITLTNLASTRVGRGRARPAPPLMAGPQKETSSRNFPPTREGLRLGGKG